MIVNRRGAYMGFEHDRASDWAWLAAWQPSVVRLMLPGSYTDPASVSVEKVRRVHDTVPGATILLRCWDVDDRNGEAHAEMGADPFGLAQRQVDWWSVVADRAGVPREFLMAGLNNEVNVDRYGAQLFDYGTAAMRRAAARGLRLCVGMFSVGTPGKPGESSYDMRYFAHWEDDIVRGRHALGLHEYAQPEGMYCVWTDEEGQERHDWQNLINRHIHWPGAIPKIIGEWGIDGLLFNRHADPTYGNSGWLNFPELWPATRLGDEYVACCQVADPTVQAICQFGWDLPDRKWNSFSPEPAAAELLARRALCEVAVQDAGEEPDNTVHIPAVVVGQPVTPAPQPTPQASKIVDPLVAEAIMQVESGGQGFSPSGRLKVRVEAHLLLNPSYGNPPAFAGRFRFNPENYLQAWYRAESGQWIEYHALGQPGEWAALELALVIDRNAALRCTSMGASQVMGFNHAMIGYSTVEAMLAAFTRSGNAHVLGLLNYCLAKPGLVQAMRVRDWAAIGQLYNGAASAGELYRRAYEELS